MKLCVLLAAALLALAATPGGWTAPPKSVPPGCWLGTGTHAGTFASGPVKAKVTSGTIQLQLWVGKGGADAVGLLKTGGIGKGTLAVSGSKLTLTIVMKGSFDVTGTASKLVVNGSDRWTGKAVGSGQFITVPVKLVLPVKNQPLTIVAVTPSRVTFRYGKAPFAAVRRKALPGPVGELC